MDLGGVSGPYPGTHMTERKANGNWMRRVMTWPALVLLIVAIGMGLRVGKAWTARFSPNSDFTVSALTAKHMAEGKDYPVFFYGAPYMGNIEPYVTLAICRLFRLEVTGFMVNLGTALVATLLLPLVYLFGRAAGGPRAGLIAMLYCLVGSDTNFHYAGVARNGFMTVITGGFLAVLMACWIVTRLRKDEKVPWTAYMCMGLAAGLGWWATQLVVYCLAATVVILLIGFRWTMVSRGLIPGTAGFLIGSLPWWWWNMTHAWGTFEFAGFLGRVPWREGLRSFWRQALVLTELSPLSTWWNLARLVLFLGMMALFVVLLVRAAGRTGERDSFYYRLAVPVLIVLAAAIYATSKNARFGASKYVLPVFPFLAVMLGVSTDWLLRRFRLPIGLIVFAVLIPPHLYQIGGGRLDLAHDRPIWERASRLADKIGPLCDGICAGEWPLHWMNFASGERLCVANLPKERYAPYARRAELAERPAFLADYAEVRTFLACTGGRSQQDVIEGIPVDYGLIPPDNGWRYVEPAAVLEVQDTEGTARRDALFDRMLDTDWRTTAAPVRSAQLTIAFARTIPFCGLRLISPDNSYPRRIVVEGQADGEAEWRVLLKSDSTRLFWSGPYAKIDGLQYVQEFRCEPPTNGLRRMRLTFNASTSPYSLCLAEIFVMEKAPGPEQNIPSIRACFDGLTSNRVERLYAPRWISERVAAAISNEIACRIPSTMTRAIQDIPDTDSTIPFPIVFGKNTGLLVDGRDAPLSRELLQARGIRWRETAVGSHALLVVSRPENDEATLDYPLLHWTELGCLSLRNCEFKPKAHALFRKAIDCSGRGEQAAQIDLLQRALQSYPRHQPARRALVAALQASGLEAQASTNAAVLRNQTVPENQAHIRFAHGFEFLGLNVSPRTAAPGESVDVSYFWKCPPEAESKRPTVFVHFLQGKKIGFQDDHNLLEKILSTDILEQPFDEIFVEQRRVQVPIEAPPGEYQVVIGLFRPAANQRLRAVTDLPHKRRAVTCPVTMQVRRAGAAG